jgi:hypothetical protein
MKKIVITSLVGLGIVGGIVLFSINRSEDESIVTIQGTNSEGVFQTITFTDNSCVYNDTKGNSALGLTDSQNIEKFCDIKTENVTSEQFSCALNLCDIQINLNQDSTNALSSGGCGNPTVTWSSQTGSCTVENCTTSDGTDLSGSYNVTEEQWLQWYGGGTDCGSGSTCLAHTCAGALSTQSEDDFIDDVKKDSISNNNGSSTKPITNQLSR